MKREETYKSDRLSKQNIKMTLEDPSTIPGITKNSLGLLLMAFGFPPTFTVKKRLLVLR